jgi:hypothetical protein
MTHDELIDYIVHELAHGTPEAEIRHALSTSGWSEADITDSFASARERHAVTPLSHEQETQQKRAFLRKHSKAIIAMSLAALLLAGSAFAAYVYMPTPERVLQQAAENTSQIKSFDFSGRITADVEAPDDILNLQALFPDIIDPRVAGASTPMQFAVDFKGSADTTDESKPKLDLDLDISSSIFTVGMKMRLLDEVIYFNFDQIPKIDEALNKYINTWIKVDLNAISEEYGLGIDLDNARPTLTDGQKQQIEELTRNFRPYSSITKLPNDSIDGVVMYHYSVSVDKVAFKNYLTEIDRINRSAGGLADTNLDAFDHIQFKDVEVWIGKKDKQIHRVAMNLSQLQTNDSLPMGTMHLLLNFSNFNNASSILEPANSRNVQDIINEVMGAPGS